MHTECVNLCIVCACVCASERAGSNAIWFSFVDGPNGSVTHMCIIRVFMFICTVNIFSHMQPVSQRRMHSGCKLNYRTAVQCYVNLLKVKRTWNKWTFLLAGYITINIGVLCVFCFVLCYVWYFVNMCHRSLLRWKTYIQLTWIKHKIAATCNEYTKTKRNKKIASFLMRIHHGIDWKSLITTVIRNSDKITNKFLALSSQLCRSVSLCRFSTI